MGFKVEFLYDNPSQAIEFLKISSKYPDTFYGKLSIQSLGYNHKINFDLPNVSQDFISWLSSKKGGLRALALLQVEEYWHADRELRKLYSSIPEKISFRSYVFLKQLWYALNILSFSRHSKS